nr:MAG TPA: hypothetical protein [Caudoviricetes sp.]
MLHTNNADCSLTLLIKRFKQLSLNCIKCMHNSSCIQSLCCNSALAVKLSKRNVEQF